MALTQEQENIKEGFDKVIIDMNQRQVALSNRDALKSYKGALANVILQDGTSFVKIISSSEPDNIVLLPVSGKPTQRWQQQGIPSVTAAMLGADPTTQLQRVINNTPARSIELTGLISNLGIINSVPDKTIYLKSGAVVEGRALNATELAAAGEHYGIFNMNAGGRITGTGTIDCKKSIRNQGNAHGIYAVNNPQAELSIGGIAIIDSAQDAIRFQNIGRATVDDVTITGSVFRGIHGIITSDVTLRNCRVSGGVHGIQWFGDYLEGQVANPCQNWTIDGCRVDNVQLGGIWGWMGKAITITGGSTEVCGDIGVDLERCMNCSINSVYIRDCTQAGIGLFDKSEDCEFNHCNVMQGAGMGPAFKLWGNTGGRSGNHRNITVTGGLLKNQPGQLCVTTMQGIAEEVKFHGVTMEGAWAELLDAHDSEFIDCTLKTHGDFGIRNLGGSRLKATGNTLKYVGTSSATARPIVQSYRSVSYPGVDSTIDGNKTYGYGLGMLDDDLGGPLAKSGNAFTGNRTVSIDRPPSNKDYTSVKYGNYNYAGQMLEPFSDANVKTIATTVSAAGWTPFLTIPGSAENTADLSHVIVSVGEFGGSSTRTFDMLIGNRDSLHIDYTLRGVQGTAIAPGVIHGFTGTDGTVTFYVYSTGFKRITATYLTTFQSSRVNSLVQQTAQPGGTLTFESYLTPPASSGAVTQGAGQANATYPPVATFADLPVSAATPTIYSVTTDETNNNETSLYFLTGTTKLWLQTQIV